jgi:hypothetical protein
MALWSRSILLIWKFENLQTKHKKGLAQGRSGPEERLTSHFEGVTLHGDASLQIGVNPFERAKELGVKMNLKNYTRIVFALALCCASLFGQTVTSSLVGTVVDPADAVVASAPVTLIDAGTGAARSATSDDQGGFRFANLAPGTYNLTVKASGFKSITQTGIIVAASETHNAGNIVLQIGATSDSVSVTAEAAQIQLASSEKSQTVDGNQLNDVTLKGRDLFGYMKLVPGVIVDNSQSRDVTSPNAIGGITINGNTSAKNFTVDGITDMDTGSNGTLHYEPNIDAIQELKVLTSNYAAEFGRNSGGTITVVTKSGTQQFHGTAAWNHRHEGFNANSWQNNHTLTSTGQAAAIQPYRFNVETYSIGGPAYIPKVLNKDKKRLFFFWSQEYTGQFVNGGTKYQYTPTALERAGDFSQTFNNNGSLVTIFDPANNNAAFPNNKIPASRINPIGLAMLNYFPLPNNPGGLTSAQVNVVNYFEAASATHPRRNDVLRFDSYITSKLSGYFRWINDHDDMVALYQGVNFTQGAGGVLGAKGISPIDHPNPGHGYSGSATYTITPTLINEVTVGESYNTWSYYSLDNYASEDRSLVPGVPSLFPLPTAADNGSVGPVNGYQNLLPTFTFGNVPTGNLMAYSRNSTSAGAYENFNTIWSYQDNLSKIVGKHTFKTGFYFEKNNKIQPAGRNYEGAYNFIPSTNNPIVNTGDGLVNALLGNVNSYQQATSTPTFNTQYYNFEAYVQDNWKVNRRLTMDLGIRFYHQTPQYDLNNTFVNFIPANYSKAAMARVYVPFCANGAASCTGVNRVAKDPLTGATTTGAYIGDFVPGTGSVSSGLTQLGVNGVSSNPYKQAPLAYGPRVGFAYDLMGDGKTAIRGGWGMFFNRLDGNQVYAMSGQAPLVLTANASFTTFAAIAAQNTGPVNLNTLVVAPAAPSGWLTTGNVPFDTVQNASLDIQRNVGRSTVVDVGYTFNWGYNQKLTYNVNFLPIGTQFPFTPSNVDPTTPNADIGTIYERTVYPGYGNITNAAFLGHTNYNALTATLSRRLQHGLAWGASYTYSKAMGTTTYNPAVANNESWNYGRLGSDRPQNLQINYNYDLPNIGKKTGMKFVGIFTDNWSLSGITSFSSGPPYNPTCGLSSGTAPNYTGTPDVTVRCNIVGNPLSNIGTNGNGQVYFNPSAYQIAAIATGPNNTLVGPPVTGNQGGGAGNLTGPHVTNFDATMTKTIPLGSEKRVLKLQAQAYNVFNHTEIGGNGVPGINTGIQFSPTTGAITNASSLGFINSTLPARIMAFSVRLQF